MSKISRREFGRRLSRTVGAVGMATALGPAAGAAVGQTGGGQGRRPNIVFLSSDNQSFQDVGYAGHPFVRTPNLDRIASQGVIFSNAYCGSPVCAPSRASMMTGMYPSDGGSFCNATPWDGSRPTWGTRLRRAGYYTRSVGKLDLDDAFDMGFEEFDSVQNHARSPDLTALFRRPLGYRIDERPNVTGGPRTERHVDRPRAEHAVSFIRTQGKTLGRPWALNVGFTEPHVAFFERQGFLGLPEYFARYLDPGLAVPGATREELENQHLVFQELRRFKLLDVPLAEERVRRARAGYYAMISELDEYVGQVWDALVETGQLESTVFVFTSDNGMCMGEHGLFYHNNLYEETAKIPLLVAGAGVPRGKRIDTPVSHVDVVATMLDWAQVEDRAGLRGHSLLPLMEGRPSAHPGFAYSENHSEGNCTGSFLVRKGDWKYVHFTWYGDLLFNLAEDPRETTNLAGRPETTRVLAEMKEILHGLIGDPDAMTLRAFEKQEDMLRRLAERSTEEELFRALEVRMGAGQARALATKHRRGAGAAVRG